MDEFFHSGSGDRLAVKGIWEFNERFVGEAAYN